MNRKQFNAKLDAASAQVKATGRTSDGMTGADVFALVARRQQERLDHIAQVQR